MPRNPSPCTRLITGGKVVGLTKYVICDALNELINQINYIYSVNEVIKLNQLKIQTSSPSSGESSGINSISYVILILQESKIQDSYIYIISYEGQSDQII